MLYLLVEQEQANELVAEFMLLANMSIAQMIGQAYPENAMLRRHPPPQDRQLGELEAISEKLVRNPTLYPFHSVLGPDANLSKSRATMTHSSEALCDFTFFVLQDMLHT